MNLLVLGSGSRGNSIAMWCDDDPEPTGILIDAGLSYKQMNLRLRANGVSPDVFKHVLVTHAHGDHQRSLRTWVDKHGIWIWATATTARKLTALQDYPSRFRKVKHEAVLFEIGNSGFSAAAYSTDHQSEGCVTYHVMAPDLVKVGCFLETGKVTSAMWKGAKGSNAYVIEANHDKGMLAQDIARPQYVNERAADGHLSNRQAMELVRYLPADVQAVVFVHLSGDCNDPGLLAETIKPVLKPSTRMYISAQDRPTPKIDVQPIRALSAEEGAT